jgi:hypothetical protein
MDFKALDKVVGRLTNACKDIINTSRVCRFKDSSTKHELWCVDLRINRNVD